MNIVENGSIDWGMFGMTMKNFRRGKGLDQAQFAELMNRVSGTETPVITEAQVKRIEDGKLKPTLDQLFAIDKVTNRPGRMTSVLSDIAECFMACDIDVPCAVSDKEMVTPDYPTSRMEGATL